jgi:hypothetical protein
MKRYHLHIARMEFTDKLFNYRTKQTLSRFIEEEEKASWFDLRLDQRAYCGSSIASNVPPECLHQE